jgi:hypothetical protein
MSEDLLDDDENVKKPIDLLSCPVCSNKFTVDPKELRVVRGDEPDINEEVNCFHYFRFRLPTSIRRKIFIGFVLTIPLMRCLASIPFVVSV